MTMLADLYEQDYYLWIQENLELLKQRKFLEMDLDNLLEEIEDMGKSEKRSISSNLRILLMHLLKYKYQIDKRSNSWLFTIAEHRQRLEDSLQTSPSLKSYYHEVFAKSYQDARKLAAAETGLPIYTFPEISPFSPADTLDSNYLPT